MAVAVDMTAPNTSLVRTDRMMVDLVLARVNLARVHATTFSGWPLWVQANGFAVSLYISM